MAAFAHCCTYPFAFASSILGVLADEMARVVEDSLITSPILFCFLYQRK